MEYLPDCFKPGDVDLDDVKKHHSSVFLFVSCSHFDFFIIVILMDIFKHLQKFAILFSTVSIYFTILAKRKKMATTNLGSFFNGGPPPPVPNISMDFRAAAGGKF
jgi:hypothetical protein